MTDKEKAVVMAYTGVAMLTGEKFSIFHNQEVEVDSWKENKDGMKYVEIDKKLDICFIGSTHGTPWIDLEVKEDG